MRQYRLQVGIVVNCRIGSLESVVKIQYTRVNVNCRIGSLEICLRGRR